MSGPLAKRASMLAFALFAAAWLFATGATSLPRAFGYDFVAFYCGASVASDGADPYRVEPLRSCEHRNGRQFRPDSKLVVPAPLPGYALAFVAPLTKFPYPLALALWSALLVAAYVVCAVILVRLTGLSPPIVVAATALSVGALSLFLGQLVPIALAALCLAASAVECRRWSAAAAWCGLAALEPHVALPAALALFVARPAARIPLLAAGAILGGLSLAFVGVAANAEFLTRVLPAQVASEMTRSDQLSLLALAYRLGAGPGVASALGDIAYPLATLLGIAFAITVERRGGTRGALIFIPPAIALVGVPYVHAHHLAAAIPAALLLAGTRQWRNAGVVAIFCLAIAWIAPYDQTPLLPFGTLVIATLSAGLLRVAPIRAAAFGALTFGLMFAAQALRTAPVPPPPSAYGFVRGSDLAQVDWNVMIGAGFHGDALLLTLLALPAWIALLVLARAALSAVLPKASGGEDFGSRVPARPKSVAVPDA